MSANTLQIVEPPTLLREQAAERLRDAIITGHFAPGDRLIERELCEAMGVSRTSIREVLRRLEAERLVVVEPRQGPTVARITRKQAAEIYELRAALEATLVRRFTEQASDEDVAKLRGIFEEVVATAKTDDVWALVALMRHFNQHMIRVVDHELIGDILQQLTARISFLRAKSMSQPGRIQTSLGEIGKIIEAIERRDPDAAAHHAMTYVGNAGAAALERIGAELAERS
jgi:GntR family transcriptional regulator, trigonelline degradation regulator